MLGLDRTLKQIKEDMEKLFSKFNLGSERLKEEKRKNDIDRATKEEIDGLNKFYNEILTPEMLERNFSIWKDHLTERLKVKYSNPIQLEAALKKAMSFADTLPIRHSTIYENISNSNIPYISSEFMVQQFLSTKTNLKTNTFEFDKKRELDHFVYCSIGIEGLGEKRTGLKSGASGQIFKHDAQVYIDNKVLKEAGTLVALEDYTTSRVWHQKNDLDKKTPFDIHLQQTWNGQDFAVLLPMMLAYGYDNLEDFNERKPFPVNLTPEGLPILFGPDKQLNFPDFEIRIPQRIRPEQILAFFVNSSAIRHKPMANNIIVVPPGLTDKNERNFIKNKLTEIQKH